MPLPIKASPSEKSTAFFLSDLFWILLLLGAFILNHYLALVILFCGILAFILRKTDSSQPTLAPEDFYRKYVRPVGRIVAWAPLALAGTIAVLLLGVFLAPLWLVGGIVYFIFKFVHDERLRKKTASAVLIEPVSNDWASDFRRKDNHEGDLSDHSRIDV
jgi:hypothetical protein